MRTWAVNLAAYEVTVLDHSNLEEYIGADTYKFAQLKKFQLQVQKDAILAAVLEKHGGIFMDADTIVTRDIAPIVKRLTSAEVVAFGRHLAFVASRPHAELLAVWREKIQERFARVEKDASAPVPMEWDYLGNAVVEEALTELAGRSRPGRMYDQVHQRQVSWPRWIRGAWRRVDDPILFRAVHGKHLRRLDRDRHGFIAEAAFYGLTRMTPREQYVKFWFEEKADLENVFYPKQRLIGLHHSWTPDWYKRLSEQEVLESDCLLSKTLRHVLAPRGSLN
jgi:hypothetical protein